MRLNKATNHAIRILIDCAQSGDGLVKVMEISGRLGITQQNTFKIVHMLSRAGLIEAVRGRRGGVRLARPASSVHIGEVVRAMETLAFDMPDGTGDGRSTGAAPMTAILDDALEAFIAVLNQHTLADMAASVRQEGPKLAAANRPAPSRRAKAAANTSTNVV
jgi:Rrf2 family protein